MRFRFHSSAAGIATLMDKPHPSRKQEGHTRFLVSLAFACVMAAVPAQALAFKRVISRVHALAAWPSQPLRGTTERKEICTQERDLSPFTSIAVSADYQVCQSLPDCGRHVSLVCHGMSKSRRFVVGLNIPSNARQQLRPLLLIDPSSMLVGGTACNSKPAARSGRRDETET